MKTLMTRLSARSRDLLLLTLLVLVMALPGISRIPAIDRDEARYAQATVQMLETGDYVDIRFQDQPRWKKPAGAYWAQAVSVSLFSSPEAREIWAHRLPSVLGMLIAVLATYLGGARMAGRRAAVIGASLFAVALTLTYEAHAAKTDALLTGFTAVCFAALIHLRHPKIYGARGRIAATLFWVSMGLAIMIKGPMTPAIVILCLLTLFIWERNAGWTRPLLFPVGPLLCALIIVPWGYLIYEKTGGAFFSTAIGEDLAPKLAGKAEKHGGPIGYYSLTVWLIYFPAAIFLLPGLVYAAKTLKSARVDIALKDGLAAKSVRFIIAFALPWWIILELMPTKLPHYTLPIYPALAILSGIAASKLLAPADFKVSRRISAVLYVIFGLILCAAAVFLTFEYGRAPDFEIAIAIIIAVVICTGAVFLWRGNARPAILTIISSGVLMWTFVFGVIMPNLDRATVSESVASALEDAGMSLPLSPDVAVLSPHYSEPSLVFALGTHIQLGGAADLSSLAALPKNSILILDLEREDGRAIAELTRKAAKVGAICFSLLGEIGGMNYSKGDAVKLAIMQEQACPDQP